MILKSSEHDTMIYGVDGFVYMCALILATFFIKVADKLGVNDDCIITYPKHRYIEQ